jgi:hypothetical protein
MDASTLTAAQARFLELAIAAGVSAKRERVLKITAGVRAIDACERLEGAGHPNPSADDIAANMLNEYGYEVES